MTKSSGRTCSGRTLATGRARGRALVLAEPLSLWGGLDPATGEVVDVHHPQAGVNVAGRVLVMPSGRGSSSSSSVLAEAIRTGRAPAALLLARADDILVVGAVAARELYGRACPVVVLEEGDHAAIASGDLVEVDAAERAARVEVEPVSPSRRARATPDDARSTERT